MQSHLPRMHESFTLDIQCQFVNVSRKHLKRSSQLIIHLSNFYLGVLASLDMSAIRCNMFSQSSHIFSGGAFTNFILPPQHPLAWCVWLAQLCNDFTSLGFGQVGWLRFHPFPVAIHYIRGPRRRYE